MQIGYVWRFQLGSLSQASTYHCWSLVKLRLRSEWSSIQILTSCRTSNRWNKKMIGGYYRLNESVQETTASRYEMWFVQNNWVFSLQRRTRVQNTHRRSLLSHTSLHLHYRIRKLHHLDLRQEQSLIWVQPHPKHNWLFVNQMYNKVIYKVYVRSWPRRIRYEFWLKVLRSKAVTGRRARGSKCRALSIAESL